MDVRVTAPGPYRATKLWNQMTKLFRAGMPLRKHRLHFKRYGNCFTASEAVDWLHELLKSNSNFGPDVTRQQTLQLLRKFLKNHVIEDIKGRWGSENVEDNSQLYRFPTTSPLKIIPRHPPFYRKNTTETYPKVKDGFLKFSERTPKKDEIPQVLDEESCKEISDVTPEGQLLYVREVTQSDREEAWREIALIHLQKILSPASLEEVLDFSQVLPQHIMYNVQNISKHGVVILQDKSDDLPHWVLSAMKCLANWPRNNDSSQPTYPGFERDVFKTVADYFLMHPEPLLTLKFYDLFVNILVLCGYIMVSKRPQGKRKNLDELYCPQPAKSQHLNNHFNFFKSTECLLLSLVRKDLSEETRRLLEPAEEEEEAMECSPKQRLTHNHRNLQKGCARHLNQHAVVCRKMHVSKQLLGGSCQNLIPLKDYHSELYTVQSRCNSVSQIAGLSLDCSSGQSAPNPAGCDHMDVSGPGDDQPHHQIVHPLASSRLRAESMTDLRSEGDRSPTTVSRCNSAWTLTEHNHEPCSACPDTGLVNGQSIKTDTQQAAVDGQRYPGLQLQRQQCYSKANSSGFNKATNSKLLSDTRNFTRSNAPVAVNSMKPVGSDATGLRRPSAFCSVTSTHSECFVSKGTDASQQYKNVLGGSEHRASATACLSAAVGSFNDAQSLLQPHLEKVAIEALQLCCLFLPPNYRRKLQLLLRMMARISQNVDMPRLHSAMGTRTLMVQTFSRCILRCETEVDLDELLATRLVSFLLDHHQDILVVPLYLSNAVGEHISHLQKAQIKYPCTGDIGSGPTYTFCQQISVKDFEEQKVSASQVAISELLENIIKDQRLSVKDKKKKLKQFQKEYPDIYQQRFPVTDSEATIFQGKPKIKPPMLLSMKRPLQSLQNLRS